VILVCWVEWVGLSLLIQGQVVPPVCFSVLILNTFVRFFDALVSAVTNLFGRTTFSFLCELCSTCMKFMICAVV
jgi:hypothetical protein